MFPSKSALIWCVETTQISYPEIILWKIHWLRL